MGVGCPYARRKPLRDRGVIKIPLRDCSGVVIAEAIVDADCSHFAALGWYLNESKAGSLYVRRSWREKGKRRSEYLHRRIAKPRPGEHVDHFDGNTLNNRRSNLQPVTLAENNQRKWRRRAAACPVPF